MAKNNMGIKTKNKILDAAHSLFNKKGIENTGVEEIAEKAGITKAMVYYHFDSKESIVLELVSNLLDSVKEELSANSADSINPENMLQHISKAMDLWKVNKELALFIISKGMKDEKLFSKIIKISNPFFDKLIVCNGDITENGLGKDNFEKLLKLMLFNAMPMLFSTVLIEKFCMEFKLHEETLENAFQEQFVKVLFSILCDK